MSALSKLSLPRPTFPTKTNSPFFQKEEIAPIGDKCEIEDVQIPPRKELGEVPEVDDSEFIVDSEVSPEETVDTAPAIKRGRGRPPKSAAPQPPQSAPTTTQKFSTDDEDDPSKLPPEQRKKREDFDDIFAYGEYLVKCGVLLKYQIRKNGEIAGTVFPPFTWDDLQKTYGPGHYQIRMFNQRTGAWIAKATESVTAAVAPGQATANPPPQHQHHHQSQSSGSNAHSESTSIGSETASAIQAMSSLMAPMLQANKENSQQMAALLTSVLRAAPQQQQAVQQSNPLESIAPIVSGMFQAMSTQSQQMQMMIAEMNKSNQTMMLELAKLQMSTQERQQEAAKEAAKIMQQALDRIHNSQTETVREMRQEMTTLLNAQRNQSGPSPTELLGMVITARDKGFETAMHLQEIAEEKAERIAERISDSSPAAKEEEPKSSTDKLIETLLPVFGAAMQAKAAAASQPQQPTPEQLQQLQLARQQQAIHAARVRKAQALQQNRARLEKERAAAAAQLAAAQQNLRQSQMPQKAAHNPSQVPAVRRAPAAAPVVAPAPVVTPDVVAPSAPTIKKRKIGLSTAAPAPVIEEPIDDAYLNDKLLVLGTALQNVDVSQEFDHAQVAQSIADLLAKQGETVANFCRKAPVNAIIQKMISLGITTDEYHTHVKGIYEHLQNIAKSSGH